MQTLLGGVSLDGTLKGHWTYCADSVQCDGLGEVPLGKRWGHALVRLEGTKDTSTALNYVSHFPPKTLVTVVGLTD